MGEKWVCLKIVNAAKRYIIIYFTKRTVRAVGKTVKPWIICDHVIPGNLGHFQTTPSSDVTFCVVSWCLDPKAKGRRLSDDLDIQRDSLGVPYEEIKCTGWPRNRWGRTRNIWAGMGRGLKFIKRRRNDVCSLCSFLPGPAVTCDFARSSALDSCPCGWASFWASLELVWWFGPSSIWWLVPQNCETVKLVPRRTWYWHSRVCAKIGYPQFQWFTVSSIILFKWLIEMAMWGYTPFSDTTNQHLLLQLTSVGTLSFDLWPGLGREIRAPWQCIACSAHYPPLWHCLCIRSLVWKVVAGAIKGRQRFKACSRYHWIT